MPTPGQQGSATPPSAGAGALPPSADGLLPRVGTGGVNSGVNGAVNGGVNGAVNGGQTPAAQKDALPGAAGESRMTLVSPTGELRDARDWAIVLGIVLGAEVVLLWGVACMSLLRRRLVTGGRAPAAPAQPGRRTWFRRPRRS
ncbi:hypothetical protein DZF91_01140 [Actinomadura logoneensis]|uniref:Uncharacterized protein n=1 Tax=Actinomadura logoneensis TaxID=2293572 RepID=A0A372JUN0_9ACTN|nr:hypothetical protein DZF91_01140 [Actinomadura logoneensis]